MVPASFLLDSPPAELNREASSRRDFHPFGKLNTTTRSIGSLR